VTSASIQGIWDIREYWKFIRKEITVRIPRDPPMGLMAVLIREGNRLTSGGEWWSCCEFCTKGAIGADTGLALQFLGRRRRPG